MAKTCIETHDAYFEGLKETEFYILKNISLKTNRSITKDYDLLHLNFFYMLSFM
jgi:hypothetical protein